jgi:hypothetical protein
VTPSLCWQAGFHICLESFPKSSSSSSFVLGWGWFARLNGECNLRGVRLHSQPKTAEDDDEDYWNVYFC